MSIMLIYGKGTTSFSDAGRKGQLEFLRENSAWIIKSRDLKVFSWSLGNVLSTKQDSETRSTSSPSGHCDSLTRENSLLCQSQNWGGGDLFITSIITSIILSAYQTSQFSSKPSQPFQHDSTRLKSSPSLKSWGMRSRLLFLCSSV